MIGAFEVSGLPWVPPDTRVSASTRSMTASVLCERHNSLLSEFDFEASRLMSHLQLLDSAATANELMAAPEEFVIDGVKLEKWLIKALCGILASGNFLIDGESFGKVAPPPYFVDLLFDAKPWKPGIGLYFEHGSDRLNAMHGVGYSIVVARAPTGGKHVEVAGIDFQLWGFPFRGLFATYEAGVPLPNYRPSRIRFVNQGVHRDVLFTWPADSTKSEGPVLTRTGTQYT